MSNSVILPLNLKETTISIELLDQLIQLPNEIEREAREKKQLLTPNNRLMMYQTLVRVWRTLVPQPHNFDVIDVLYGSFLDKAGFSIGHIAVVLDRSKSSVHEFLTR